jgi:ribose transport system ATP-binding protein
MLTLTGIAKRFGATVALDGVDLELRAGEVHALIGENGAGKSTLLNILSGLIAADAGSMTLGDARYTPDSPIDARRSGIAHIHQELALCPHLSVAENILLGAEGSRVLLKRDEIHSRATHLLTEFGRAEIDPRVRTSSLSLADQQVVEVCRALAADARVILMDEPTSSLQRANVERLFRLIRQLRERGIAIIYISHFLEEVREIADRFTVLRDGRSIRSGQLRDVRDEELIAAMVGRQVAGFPGSRVPETSGNLATWQLGNPILEVRNLASPPRLHSATFELRRGEILGIAGLIGSGRTDLVRALFGLQQVTGGEIVTMERGAGSAERGKSRGSALRAPSSPLLGYLSEDRKGEGLALPMSIADNVTISRLRSVASHGWIDRRRQDESTSKIMQWLRIKAPHPRVPVARLSGGNQQKVAVGRLLHQDPDILLLDEPARGVDIGSKSDIYDEIVRLARGGKAILMVSSYLPELLGVCDRIAVMTRGRLSPARPTAEWTPDSIMEVAISAA